MSNRHWIKLWLAALDDARLATLDDSCWRLAVELFMIAGENGDDGKIPDIKSISWRLRRNEKETLSLLKELEQAGIIRKRKRGYTVAAFKKRQSAVTNALRQKAHRMKDDITGRYQGVYRQDKTRNRKEGRGRKDKTAPKKRARYLGNLNE
jgi:hypothetical protein